MSKPSARSRTATSFASPSPAGGPLSDWPNDDLLFEQKHRDFIWRRHPNAAPIFDWPELRDLFGAHDPPAGHFRARSRRLGLAAVGLGCASLVLSAFLAAISLGAPGAVPWLGALAALLAVASGIFGFSGVLSGRDKSRWLNHRFWTERMRQLHFQLIVNNLPDASAAIADPARHQDWFALRAAALDAFEHAYMGPLAESLERMREDLALDRPWLDDRWSQPAPVPQPSPATDELFMLLKQQRFGIQRRYATYKLMEGRHSPRTRSRWLRTSADLLTVLTLLVAIALGLVYLFADSQHGAVAVLAGAGGALAALILSLRVLDEGLLLRSETERYLWYLAAVESLERRYEAGDAAAKVAVLREMERLSYQELRWFTVTFDESRFVM